MSAFPHMCDIFAYPSFVRCVNFVSFFVIFYLLTPRVSIRGSVATTSSSFVLPEKMDLLDYDLLQLYQIRFDD